MRIDLHNHTIHSDGVLNEEELILRAKKNNVDVFALTDHDSVFGCKRILELSKKYDIKVILGMELSTLYKGEQVHIVCLFKNNNIPDKMLQFSIENKQKRINRAIKMMNNIHDIYGLYINLDEFINSSEIITRANMMRHIAKYNNMTLKEAKKYIMPDSKAFIPSSKITVEEGLKIAKESDAITIFAHPCLIKNQDYVEEILSLGFDGIEVRYPKYENMEEKYKKLADKYHLFYSAGSDCHGDETHSDIGTCTLNEDEFMPIAKLLNFKFD